MQNNTTTKPLNQNKMKESKRTPEYLRKWLWAKFMKIKPLARKNVYGNSFERFCKKFYIHTVSNHN